VERGSQTVFTTISDVGCGAVSNLLGEVVRKKTELRLYVLTLCSVCDEKRAVHGFVFVFQCSVV